MFSHIMIGTNDLDRAKVFYDNLLGTLGVPPGTEEPLIGYAVIATDVRQHAFPLLGQEFWAKDAMLIPQDENIIGICWG